MGVVAAKLISVGPSVGSIVIGFVVVVHPFASRMVMVYVPGVRPVKVSAPAPPTKLMPSRLYS